MSHSVIETRALHVSLDDKKVLKDLSFNVNKGEVFALLGGNGAGKSTTLKTLLGFIQPMSGDIFINQQSVIDNAIEARRNIAYLPESAALYDHLTAIENLNYFLSLANIQKQPDAIADALTRVALQPSAWQQTMKQYSKGMRQKVALALALLRNAPILFLDEPTSGLDPVAIDEFNRLVSQLAEEGATVLMVTHDVYGACQVAHRIGLLRDGQLVGTNRYRNSPRRFCAKG
jgi:ABC-2 type transport system ATP-binding protein